MKFLSNPVDIVSNVTKVKAIKESKIKIDKTELADAQWFHLSTLPKLPPHASIARGLIDTYRLERGF